MVSTRIGLPKNLWGDFRTPYERFGDLIPPREAIITGGLETGERR
jgi:hypothetical protein